MIYRVGAIVLIGIVLVMGIGTYISPDDLIGCQQPTEGACAPADAIVVISGGDTDARTDEAIRLYQRGWAPLIVVSGAAADKTSISNAEAMRRRAIDQGVPDTAIVTESRSETTSQNALEVGHILQQRRINAIILVTSRYHARRAQLEFTAKNPHTTVRSRPTATERYWSGMWWLTPWGWWLAGSELVKIGAFYIGGSR